MNWKQAKKKNIYIYILDKFFKIFKQITTPFTDI